jgi:hypothetical protein
MTSFHDILKNGYVKDKKNNLNGYILDNQYSNDDHQVYYHPEKKKLLYNVTGTQNNFKNGFRDWVNNGHLLLGTGYKKTKRYNDEKETLKKSKEKYGTDNAIILGHSQGGYISSQISDPIKDKVYNLDKASTFGQKVRQNEINYAHKNDVVSLLTNNNKYFGNDNLNILDSHKVDLANSIPLFF